ncbi:hypothetical protein BU197_06435 [Streptomyces sp. CBMA291]|nr:hypothetical protein [Streptomyces sp. CBMA291]MBD0715857.1 hypothetical protein [Streptomyces sp. CBMA370]
MPPCCGIRVYGDKFLEAWPGHHEGHVGRHLALQRPEDNQKWTPRADGSIRGIHLGPCLDANGAGTADGTPAVLWTCNDRNNQQWNTLP